MVIPTVTAAVVLPCDAPASHIFGKVASDLLVPLVQHTASGQMGVKVRGDTPRSCSHVGDVERRDRMTWKGDLSVHISLGPLMTETELG